VGGRPDVLTNTSEPIPPSPSAVLRLFDVFAEAAGLDVERVRRWTQYHAVDAAFWGRRQGFSGVRGGAELEHMVALCELAAEVLDG